MIFHTGIRVPDLERATRELAGVATSWCEPVEIDQAVWTPNEGSAHHSIRFTYSTEGPHHLELVEGAPESPWHAGDAAGTHHVGMWVDDVPASASRLRDRGWSIVAANAAPADGLGAFAYLAPPSGLIVELVDARARPRFERWWAGGGFA